MDISFSTMYTIIVYQTKETQNTQRGLRQMETDKSHDEKWKQHYQQCREKKSKYYRRNECKDEEKGYRTKVDRIYIQK